MMTQIRKKQRLLPGLFGLFVTFLCLFAGCNQEAPMPATQGENQIVSSTGPIVYVALGDSTGAGVGAREGGYVARLHKRILERRNGSNLVNLCVSGATTEDVLQLQLQRGVAANPDLVTLGVGINDIGHRLTLDQFSKNYEEILSTLKQKTRAAIVVTNLPDISSAPRIPGSMRREYQGQIEQYSRRLEEIAARHGVTVFDIYTITTTELASHPEYFSADGFHPSDAGYELWAEEMWPTLARILGD
jgi:lysophospholipase L1-like esterase